MNLAWISALAIYAVIWLLVAAFRMAWAAWHRGHGHSEATLKDLVRDGIEAQKQRATLTNKKNKKGKSLDSSPASNVRTSFRQQKPSKTGSVLSVRMDAGSPMGIEPGCGRWDGL